MAGLIDSYTVDDRELFPDRKQLNRNEVCLPSCEGKFLRDLSSGTDFDVAGTHVGYIALSLIMNRSADVQSAIGVKDARIVTVRSTNLPKATVLLQDGLT